MAKTKKQSDQVNGSQFGNLAENLETLRQRHLASARESSYQAVVGGDDDQAVEALLYDARAQGVEQCIESLDEYQRNQHARLS